MRERRNMTTIALTEEMQGNLKPQWWLEPFLMGVMVGVGFMILVMTIMGSAL